MSRNLYDLLGLISAVAFILALKGLSHPKSARRGNLIGAAGAGVATFVVFFYKENGHGLHNLPLIIGALVVGIAVGVPAARMVQMTQMPQMVALFNGVGGGAAALVAIVEYLNLGDSATTLAVIATVFTVIVGCISFSGSVITFLKLQELMTTRPVIFPGGRFVIAGTLVAIIANAGLVIKDGGNTSGWRRRCTNRNFTIKCIYWFNSCR
jgi:NAD(P) transhydrogenase subunit beta